MKMWFLTSSNDKRVIYIIPPNEITIGRSVDAQVCNFAIPDDPSISRKHATLLVFDNKLILQDLGSRYGTFLNNCTETIEGNTNIILNENDIVKFGKMNSIWKVHSVNLVTCTSTLKGENLQNLKLALSKIGGVFKTDWDASCSYLTMPAITLTIKVVLALVQGSHIVTTDFWNKCLEAVNDLTALPDAAKYTPKVVESTLNKEVVSFVPDARRQALFSGKKFVFLSRRQFEMYKNVLIASSASPVLLSESRMTSSMLAERDMIVIQYNLTATSQETQLQRNQINDIINYLKNKGKRVIADAEIGLAILYCSTEKYCNPDFSFTSEVVKQTGQSNKPSNVLAPESQEPVSKLDSKKGNMIINESLVTDDKKHALDDIDRNSKRKLGEFTSDAEANPNKKVAHVADTPSNIESGKRRHSGDEDTSNPFKKMAVDNSDEVFNFVNNASTNDNKSKKLNLSKPQKRKLDAGGDGLFNFIQTDEDKLAAETSKRSMFDTDKFQQDDEFNVPIKLETIAVITPEEVTAMRGAKLKELMESNLSYNAHSDLLKFKIKKEKFDELEEKMSGLDLGCTIVITCPDLIVKKEPIYKEENENTSVKNFKKFKKVWPLKRQVTGISTSTSIVA